ncbi:MAG TPA: thermopsin family protease [Thermoplasmata archaeon]|nr:thermopsin family protease [Thermoplasmata archaeon]
MVVQRRVLVASVAVVMIFLGSSVLGFAARTVPASGSPAAAAAPAATSAVGVPTATVAHAADTPSAPVTNAAATDSVGARAIAASRAAGVPLRDVFLPAPDLYSGPRALGPDGIVQPSYTSAPAPIGEAYFGVYNDSGTPAATVTNTTSLEGTLTDYNLTPMSVDAGAPDYYGAQLNAVLTNVSLLGTYGYQFWTQNVIEYSEYQQQLQFLDNVWNFSSPAENLSLNAFASHGPTGEQVGYEYYYAIGPLLTISVPFTVSLFLNTTVLPDGNQAVFFNYTVVHNTEYYSGTYDYVEFNSTGGGHPAAHIAEFQANGTGYNPTGYLPDDWEMVLGGPGGGSNADFLFAEAAIGLYYLNSTDVYASVPSAQDFGGDTGETAIGASVSYYANGGQPYEQLYTGPTWWEGLWNTTDGVGPGWTYLQIALDPTNAFLFLAMGDVSFAYSSQQNFSWAPELPPGYRYVFPGSVTQVSVVVLLANYEPDGFYAPTNRTASVDLFFEPANGVYTPLWASNESEWEAVTLDGVHLANNVYGPVGGFPGFTFQWFGTVNDYLFPVFPGVFLQNLDGEFFPVEIAGANSLTASVPSWQTNITAYYGVPSTNQLMDYFYNDTFLQVSNSTFGGWWYTYGFFGSTSSQANVVFWNTSYSILINNTFATGTDGLFLYGGEYNVILNNTFEEKFPTVLPNPDAIAGYWFGPTGLTEEDYGDYIINNIFLTYWTAVNPAINPYTSTFTEAFYGFFYESWNITPTSFLGPNIIGGPFWSGNYWWNYGTADSPFGQPYDALGAMFWNSDFRPLWPTALYTVSFEESGLPAGALWEVATNDPFGGGYVYNGSTTATVNQTWPNGTYDFTAYAYAAYGMVSSTVFSVDGGDLVVDVEFLPLENLELVESGLPSGTWWTAVGYSYTTESSLTNSSTSPYLNLTVVNGSTYWFVYTATAAGQVYEAYPYNTGTVTVAGTTVVEIEFLPLYSLNFTVSGLPVGTTWTVVIYGGAFGSYGEFVTGDYFDFSEIFPATYTWTIYAAGYTASPASGTVSLTANKTVDVSFGATRQVTFTESGLTPGAAWSVWFTQGSKTVEVSGTGTTLVVPAIAGTYNYTVRADGYSAAPSNGSGTLGANATVVVALSKNPGPTTTFLGVGPMNWGLVAFAFIALAIVGLALAALFRGRSKKPAEMTPYTTAPAGAAGGAGAPAPPAGAAGTPAWKEDDAGPPAPPK